MTALPKFDLQACLATGWCVASCPTDCIDLWNDQPQLAYPQRCIDCGVCVLVCPTQAVSLADSVIPVADPDVHQDKEIPTSISETNSNENAQAN